MSLWSNFNRPSEPSAREGDDNYSMMNKDLRDWDHQFFQQHRAMMDEMDRRARKMFNDPFFTGFGIGRSIMDDEFFPRLIEKPEMMPEKSEPAILQNKEDKNQAMTTMTSSPNRGRWLNWPSFFRRDPFQMMRRTGEQIIPSTISIDVSESPDRYQITAALPGVEKENINCEIDQDRMGRQYLKISANKKIEKKETEKDGKCIYSESLSGSCSRIIPLPEDVNLDKDIDARIVNGELKLAISRIHEKKMKPKQITIN